MSDEIPDCPYCGAKTYDIWMCAKCGNEICENCEDNHKCSRE